MAPRPSLAAVSIAKLSPGPLSFQRTMPMTTGVRAERSALSGLARVYVWLTQHRGATVELPGDARRLTIGFPLTAARAAICAVSLHDPGDNIPVVSGCVRAIAGADEAEPVRLLFTGRGHARLARGEGEAIASAMLDSMAECILFDDLLESVA